jgi:hypothetical protein
MPDELDERIRRAIQAEISDLPFDVSEQMVEDRLARSAVHWMSRVGTVLATIAVLAVAVTVGIAATRPPSSGFGGPPPTTAVTGSDRTPSPPSSSQPEATNSPAASLHVSGIEVVGPEVHQPDPASEDQAVAFSTAWQFAMDNPDDFGYPWLDTATGALELTAVSEQARTLAVEELAPLLGDVSYSIRNVALSYAQLEEIKDAVTYLAAEGVDGAELVWQTEPDFRNNRIIVTMSELHDGLLIELASRYGAQAVAVRVEPNPGIEGQ